MYKLLFTFISFFLNLICNFAAQRMLTGNKVGTSYSQKMKQLLNILLVVMLLPFAAYSQQVVAQNATQNSNTELAEQPVGDSVSISILTCTPGTLVYELYGHTAIRVREFGEHESDWVFNYGTFSFKQPHFMWRFILGNT